MSLLGNALHNLAGSVIKPIFIKLFLRKKIFGGNYSTIQRDFKDWRAKRDILIIESYYHRGRTKKLSFEVFWYVEDNKLMHWCGLNIYRYKRNYVNGLGPDYKRQTG